MVKRVSERVARGSTLSLALAAECHPQINEESWKKTLQRHPELSPHYEAAKGQFLDAAMRRLAESDDLKYLCWLLERRHSELFHKPEPAAAVVNVSQHVGIPEDVLARARQIASEGPQDHGPKDQGTQAGVEDGR